MADTPQTTRPKPTDAEIARLSAWREREVQAMGAAISRRDWHAAEAAYNDLRDKMDRALVGLRRGNPPLSEYEQWQYLQQ